MYDFVELFVLTTTWLSRWRESRKLKKNNGAVFDVLPRFRLYKKAFSLSMDARETCLKEMCVSLLTERVQPRVASSSPRLEQGWSRVALLSERWLIYLKRSYVFWISGWGGKVEEEAIIGARDASRIHVEVLLRIFSVKKQFRGKRLIFYNLWDFMWRVF